MKNYLWNMLIAIKNGQIAQREFVFHKKKKLCEAFLKVLWSEGFILGYTVNNDRIKIILKYVNNQPVIRSLNFLSRPGRRVYYSHKQIWKIDSTKYFIVLSTNKGLKTLLECKKLRIGGEPFLVIN